MDRGYRAISLDFAVYCLRVLYAVIWAGIDRHNRLDRRDDMDGRKGVPIADATDYYYKLHSCDTDNYSRCNGYRPAPHLLTRMIR